MNTINNLFQQRVAVVNIGISVFQEDLVTQEVEEIQVDWQPPAGGNVNLIEAVYRTLNDQRVWQANQWAVEAVLNANPVLIDMDLAINVIPGMTKSTILHAGPPIEWEHMCGPMKGAVIGAIIYEGLAPTPREAEDMAGSGRIHFSSCHDHNAVGPMAGIISASMPVHIVENKTNGNYSYCTVNEGLGKVLRFGSYDTEVLERLRWIRQELFPTLKTVIGRSGGIDLKSLISQALQMGDEGHNRNKAATSLFVRAIAPYFCEADIPRDIAGRVLAFLRSNDHYFLNLSMPACKASLDAAYGIPYSSIVTAMARNGVEFGIQISGLPEKQWFTGPAQMLEGLLFPGFKDTDANPDIGDSTITETMGLGGFAMGGAPAIIQFVGGNISDAIAYSTKMYDITWTENSNFSIPNLDFKGTPTGIDICKVVQIGELPIINSGIAHKEAGVGQIGAGLVHPPMQCFEDALLALVDYIEVGR